MCNLSPWVFPQAFLMLSSQIVKRGLGQLHCRGLSKDCTHSFTTTKSIFQPFSSCPVPLCLHFPSFVDTLHFSYNPFIHLQHFSFPFLPLLHCFHHRYFCHSESPFTLIPVFLCFFHPCSFLPPPPLKDVDKI